MRNLIKAVALVAALSPALAMADTKTTTPGKDAPAADKDTKPKTDPKTDVKTKPDPKATPKTDATKKPADKAAAPSTSTDKKSK